MCQRSRRVYLRKKASGQSSKSEYPIFRHRTELLWHLGVNVYMSRIVHWQCLKWKTGHQSQACGWKFNIRDSLHIVTDLSAAYSAVLVIVWVNERGNIFGVGALTWFQLFCSSAGPDSCVCLCVTLMSHGHKLSVFVGSDLYSVLFRSWWFKGKLFRVCYICEW